MGENLRNQLSGLQHLLKIVQNKQKGSRGFHLIGNHLRYGTIRHLLQIESLHDRSADKFRAGDGSQRHKLNAAGKALSQMFRDC